MDFVYGARVEALALLGRFEEARAVLADAKARCDDTLQLLRGAEEILEEHEHRPRLRVV